MVVVKLVICVVEKVGVSIVEFLKTGLLGLLLGLSALLSDFLLKTVLCLVIGTAFLQLLSNHLRTLVL